MLMMHEVTVRIVNVADKNWVADAEHAPDCSC